MEYKTFVLDNGSKLGFLYTPGSKTAAVGAYLPAGFRHDPHGKPGVAHMSEHMLLSGTKKYPTSQLLASASAKYGGWQSAFTWIEHQEHLIKLPKEQFSKGVDIMCETLQNSLLKVDELEKEKGVVKEEILRNFQDPEKAIWDYGWNKLFWDDSSITGPYTGTLEDLKKIKIEDIKEFIQRKIRSIKSVYLVVGDLPEEEVFDKFNNHLGQIKLELEEKQKLSSPVPGGKAIVLESKEQASQFMLGFKTAPMDSKDYYALEIIVNLLGGSFSGKLVWRLRDEGGYIYNWETWQDALSDTGYVFFKSATEKTQLIKVLKIVCEEFKNLGDVKKIPKEDFLLARNSVTGGLYVNNDTSHERAHFFGLQELLKGHALEVEGQIDIYNKITPEDLSKVANKYFTADNWYVVIMGNVKEKDLENLVGDFFRSSA